MIYLGFFNNNSGKFQLIKRKSLFKNWQCIKMTKSSIYKFVNRPSIHPCKLNSLKNFTISNILHSISWKMYVNTIRPTKSRPKYKSVCTCARFGVCCVAKRVLRFIHISGYFILGHDVYISYFVNYGLEYI
jgi:hypothetical protein